MNRTVKGILAHIIKGTGGDILDCRVYKPDEGGGFSILVSNEYAALKLYHHYRYSKNVALDTVPRGWAVCVRS